MTLKNKTNPSASQEHPPEQLELAIEHAPLKVRQHGLRDAHSYPLVSRGKGTGVELYSFRVPAHEAWEYPSLELRAANSWPCLILDLDGREATNRLRESVIVGDVAEPNWEVTRRLSLGTHAVWCLERPVHRGAEARLAPLKMFGRTSEYYAYLLGADNAYCHVLTHNPMFRGLI